MHHVLLAPATYLELVGGLGIFLLGMIVLTDGLRTFVGGRLHAVLLRFTAGRAAAITTGAVATILLQSSSATIVATIGLVTAGCLPLANAVGVVIGANLGTTSTAWVVIYLGLKLNLSAVASLLVTAGALARLGLFGRRLVPLGIPIAGFGLLFVGLTLMQDAMVGVAGTLLIPPAAGLAGLLALVAVGAFMTVILQSSSAAVVATVMALSAGVIGLDQAAALVIGQNLGTTTTSLLASLGADLTARRVAWAHIIFNAVTAVVALPFLLLLRHVQVDPAIALALFHTAFNALGVLLIAPWLSGFTRLISLGVRSP